MLHILFMTKTTTKTYRATATELRNKPSHEVKAAMDNFYAKACAAKSKSSENNWWLKYFAAEDVLKGALGAWA